MEFASAGESRTDEHVALDFRVHFRVPAPSPKPCVHDQTADVPGLFRLRTGIRFAVRGKPIWQQPSKNRLKSESHRRFCDGSVVSIGASYGTRTSVRRSSALDGHIRNGSNPAQNCAPLPVIVICRRCETFVDDSVRLPAQQNSSQPMGRKREGESMEPGTRRFRGRLLRRLASVSDLLRKLLAILAPQAGRVQSQRMCPFCGLITPRHKIFCLECGKSLTPT